MTHVLLQIVVTDNGSNFTSDEFEEFLNQNEIRQIRTAPFHSASNGLAERAVQLLKEKIKKRNEGSVKTRVSRFLVRYRITPQTSTGVSPVELLLGRKMKIEIGPCICRCGKESTPKKTFSDT